LSERKRRSWTLAADTKRNLRIGTRRQGNLLVPWFNKRGKGTKSRGMGQRHLSRGQCHWSSKTGLDARKAHRGLAIDDYKRKKDG